VDTSIELEFGDGKYRFWLPMAQIVAIEAGEKSIMQIWSDLGDALSLTEGGDVTFIGGGAARFKEVGFVIRHALIGGGEGLVDGVSVKVSPIDATRIVETYVYARPLAESLPVAWMALQAAIFGVRLKKKAEPEPVKRSRSARGKSSRTAASSG